MPTKTYKYQEEPGRVQVDSFEFLGCYFSEDPDAFRPPHLVTDACELCGTTHITVKCGQLGERPLSIFPCSPYGLMLCPSKDRVSEVNLHA